MQALIISDIHGDKQRFLDILEANREADTIISLGDSELKRRLLEKHDVIAIKGNYPFDSGFTYEHVLKLDGRRTLLTHGHKHRIKHTYQQLYGRMLQEEAVLALHGHTHAPTMAEVAGRYILNPGSASKSRSPDTPDSYLLLHFIEDGVVARWYDAATHEPFREETLEI